MKCPRCGKEIPEKAKFCPYCGFRLEAKDGEVKFTSDEVDSKDKTLEINEDNTKIKKEDVTRDFPQAEQTQNPELNTSSTKIPIYKKWWFWAMIIFLSIFGFGGFIILLIGILTSGQPENAGKFSILGGSNEPSCIKDTFILDGTLELPSQENITYVPDVTEYLLYDVYGPYHLDTNDTLKGYIEYSWPDVDAPEYSDAFLSSDAVLMVLGPRNLSKLKRGVGIKLKRWEENEIFEGEFYSITFPQIYGYKVPLTWNSQTGGTARFSYTPEQEADYYVVVVTTPLITSSYKIETDSWGNESVRQEGYSLIGGKFSYVINAEHTVCK